MRKWVGLLASIIILAVGVAGFATSPTTEGSVYDSTTGKTTHYLNGHLIVGTSTSNTTTVTDIGGGQGIFTGSVTATNITTDETNISNLTVATSAIAQSTAALSASTIALSIRLDKVASDTTTIESQLNSTASALSSHITKVATDTTTLNNLKYDKVGGPISGKVSVGDDLGLGIGGGSTAFYEDFASTGGTIIIYGIHAIKAGKNYSTFYNVGDNANTALAWYDLAYPYNPSDGYLMGSSITVRCGVSKYRCVTFNSDSATYIGDPANGVSTFTATVRLEILVSSVVILVVILILVVK